MRSQRIPKGSRQGFPRGSPRGPRGFPHVVRIRVPQGLQGRAWHGTSTDSWGRLVGVSRSQLALAAQGLRGPDSNTLRKTQESPLRISQWISYCVRLGIDPRAVFMRYPRGDPLIRSCGLPSGISQGFSCVTT